MRGIAKSTLWSLWRKAILVLMPSCIFCGNRGIEELEIHHIVRCRHKILRYDIRNGVPVCNTPSKGCHRYAHTKAGEDTIRKIIGEDTYKILCELELKTIKQYTLELGITENEFLLQKKKEMEAVINDHSGVYT